MSFTNARLPRLLPAVALIIGLSSPALASDYEALVELFDN